MSYSQAGLWNSLQVHLFHHVLPAVLELPSLPEKKGSSWHGSTGGTSKNHLCFMIMKYSHGAGTHFSCFSFSGFKSNKHDDVQGQRLAHVYLIHLKSGIHTDACMRIKAWESCGMVNALLPRPAQSAHHYCSLQMTCNNILLSFLL